MNPTQLLSDEARLTASAIRLIRTRLNALYAGGTVPPWCAEQVSTIIVQGLDVARALEALVDAPPARTAPPPPAA